MSNAIAIYTAVVFALSIVCFAAYGSDKRRAGLGGRRVPELTLQILALSGGWPGGWLAQRQFRRQRDGQAQTGLPALPSRLRRRGCRNRGRQSREDLRPLLAEPRVAVPSASGVGVRAASRRIRA